MSNDLKFFCGQKQIMHHFHCVGFQVIMNVETGLWNASLPECAKCGAPEDSIWHPTKAALV
jgi:hypothetical protein